MNFNLVNDQHSTIEIPDLSELTVHFSATAAETASNIHILHNHNLWWVLSYSKSAKAMFHVINFMTDVNSHAF
jgi:hypothetical protein